MLTHAQSLRVFAEWSDVVGLREGDRYLIVNPFFHTFGYKAGFLSCIIQGATIIPHAFWLPSGRPRAASSSSLTKAGASRPSLRRSEFGSEGTDMSLDALEQNICSRGGVKQRAGHRCLFR